MNRLLRILHLEDDPDFSELVKSMLAVDGLAAEVCLVAGRSQFEAAVGEHSFDAILADYQMPDYDGLQALECAHARCPDTPFILVSGTIGESAAIASLRYGATDYVLKLWPERLVPAIRRALQEAEDRRQRQYAEKELLRRESYFRALTENSLDILAVLDRDGLYLYNSPSLHRILGYDPAAMLGKVMLDFVHPEDLPGVQQTLWSGLSQMERVRFEFRFRHADASWRDLEVMGQNRLADPAVSGIVLSSHDVSERKRLEAELRLLSGKRVAADSLGAVPAMLLAPRDALGPSVFHALRASQQLA